MEDQRSKAGDELERAIARAKLGWEWWAIGASVLFLAARVLPWLIAGAPVAGR